MRILITRRSVNGLPPRDFVWSAKGDERLWSFHAHILGVLLDYEARPISLES